jgi:hypothetical protein
MVDKRWAEAITTSELAVQGYEASGIPEALGYARNAQAIACWAWAGSTRPCRCWTMPGRTGVEVQSPRTEGLSLYNLAGAHWIAHEAARDAARDAADAFRRSGAPTSMQAKARRRGGGDGLGRQASRANRLIQAARSS